MKKRITDTEKHIGLLASGVIVEIKNRTLSGRDVNGSSFKDYTPSYKKFKTDNYGSGKPNLFARGNMFKAMQYKVIPNGIRLFFNITNEKLKASGNHNINKREFWGLSASQSKDIVNKLKKYFRTT